MRTLVVLLLALFATGALAQSPVQDSLPPIAGTGITVSGFTVSSLDGNVGSSPSSTTVAGTSADCGKVINTSSAGGTMTYTMPPVSGLSGGCTIKFRVSTSNALTLAPNADATAISGLGPSNLNYTTSSRVIPLPGQNQYFDAAFDASSGTATWLIKNMTPALSTILDTGNAAIMQHGQVQLLKDSGTGNLKLCPYNGNGLIINGLLRQIPTGCAWAPAPSGTHLEYIYASEATFTVTGAVSGTGGVVRLTVNASGSFATGDTICAANIVGTVEANTCVAGTLVDSTHIEEQGVTFVNAYVSGGKGQAIVLVPATTAYTQQTVNNQGVLVRSGTTSQTLVGLAETTSGGWNDSNTTRNVASFFNPVRKRMIVQSAGAYTWAAGTAGTFLTPSTPIEGQFVAFAAPYPGSAVEWNVFGDVSQTLTNQCGISAAFNTTAQSGSASTTAQLEQQGLTSAATLVPVAFSVGGLFTLGTTDQLEFMDLAGWATTTTCTLSATTPGTIIEAFITQ